MNEFDEHMLDRELDEALGGDAPAPELQGRILDAMNGKPVRTRRPSGRVMPLPAKRTPWGAYVAAAAAVILAVGVAFYALTRPDPAPKDEDYTARPGNTETAPDDTPVPRPGPEPELQPQPKPEDSGETPAPEPEKPDTQPKPEEHKVAGVLLSADSGLEYRVLEAGDWLKLQGNEIVEGWQLKADKPADLRLANGALLRFEGELRIKDNTLDVLGRSADVYVDALGTTGELTVRHTENSVRLSGSEVYVDASSSSLEVCCYVGTVNAGTETINAGYRAKVSSRGVSGVRELRDSDRSPRLLKDMPPRVLMREDFDGGTKKVFGENSFIDHALKPELTNLPGMEIRIRFRAKGGALYVQGLREAGNGQWGVWLPLGKQDEWLEWSIPVSDLRRDDGKGEDAPALGEVFRSLKIFIQDGKDAELEIDRLEIVRVRGE